MGIGSYIRQQPFLFPCFPGYHHDIFSVTLHPIFKTLIVPLSIAPLVTMFFTFLFTLALASAVLAAKSTTKPLNKRCTNDANDRSCWGDFDISTNYYDDGPDTGVIREYWFNVEAGTAAPDGFERPVMTINGSFPGPTIIADWGDTVGKDATTCLPQPSLIPLQSSM
jgi:Multicopper oxidase